MESSPNTSTVKPADQSKPNKGYLSSKSVDDSESSTRHLSTILNFPKKSDRRVVTDIKLHETLSSVPLDSNSDVFEIRNFKKQPPVKWEESTIITINVSGDRFQTHLSTLQLYPDTLLGNDKKRSAYWNPKTEEYFFDRHRVCFEAILYYYQSQGRLRRPDFVPLDTFLEEITFFELGSDALKQIHKEENIKQVEKIPLPRALWRRYVWFYMEYSEYSKLGRIISLISILFTFVSCVTLAVETLPTIAKTWQSSCNESNSLANGTKVSNCDSEFASPFFIIHTICVSIFTIEFILRFISTPSYCRFLLSPLNWIDLCSIVPYYVLVILRAVREDILLQNSALLGIRLLRVLRFTRIFKLSRICRQLKSLRVLGATVRESWVDFVAMITILTLLAFSFGAATYFAEREANNAVFDSIPVSLYWGVITITGVGYGDMFPISVVGRIITCFCALFGPATMGMLVSVILERYQRVYNRKMYTTEPEISKADLDGLSISHERHPSIIVSERVGEKQGHPSPVSSSPMKLPKLARHSMSSRSKEPYTLQFHVAIHQNDRDERAAEELVAMMKGKLTEAVSDTDMEISLKLVDPNNQELWNICHNPSSPRIQRY